MGKIAHAILLTCTSPAVDNMQDTSPDKITCKLPEGGGCAQPFAHRMESAIDGGTYSTLFTYTDTKTRRLYG